LQAFTKACMASGGASRPSRLDSKKGSISNMSVRNLGEELKKQADESP
jgi:hypothetical protein